MSTPEQEIETLERFKSNGIFVVQYSCVGLLEMWEAIKAAREALECYTNARPQCICSANSGCETAYAREEAKRVIAKIDALGN